MSEEKNILERIDAFLDGNMPESERLSFEELIGKNANLANEVELAKVARQVLIDYESSKLSLEISKDLANIKAPQRFNKWFIGGAAAILLVGLISWFSFQKSENTSANPITHTRQETTTPSINQTVNQNDNFVKEQPISEELNTIETKDITTVEETTITTPSLQDDGNSTAEITMAPQKQQEGKNQQSTDLLEADQQIEDVGHPKELPIVKKEVTFEPIDFKLKTTPTYRDEPSGKIRVDIINDNGLNYEYSIDNGESFQRHNKFDFLEEGEYSIVVKSGDQISKTTTLTLNSLPCNKNYDKTYSPDVGMNWTAPAVADNSGNFILQNQNGVVVFETTFESNDRIEWDGISNKNQQITSGYYRFTINYDSGEKCFGDLTILR